jgi:hypothetical protein
VPLERHLFVSACYELLCLRPCFLFGRYGFREGLGRPMKKSTDFAALSHYTRRRPRVYVVGVSSAFHPRQLSRKEREKGSETRRTLKKQSRSSEYPVKLQQISSSVVWREIAEFRHGKSGAYV